MADKTPIKTVATVYLGGQVRGFSKGSEFAMRSDHAADLIKAGHVEDLTPTPAPAVAEPEHLEAVEHLAEAQPTEAVEPLAEHPAEP